MENVFLFYVFDFIFYLFFSRLFLPVRCVAIDIIMMVAGRAQAQAMVKGPGEGAGRGRRRGWQHDVATCA